MLRNAAIFCALITTTALNAAALEPLGQVEARVKKNLPKLNVPFTVGMWGYTPIRYLQGNDMALPMRMMRMNYMNFMHRPWQFMKDPEVWARGMKNWWVPFSEKYHVYISPNVQGVAPLDKPMDLAKTRQLIDKYIKPYKDNKRILMWYFKDEPHNLQQRENFIRTCDLFQQATPGKPLIVLFQCDWSKVTQFAPFCGVLIHDHYPVGRPLAQHGWVSAMDNYGNGRPQYVTLATHDYNGGNIRFPTIADIRLQSYISVANGAEGVNYFIMSYPYPNQWWHRPGLKGMLDGYGVPYGDVWEKLGQMAKSLQPAGQCLIGAKRIQSPWLHGSAGQTGNPKRPMVELKALQGANANETYVVAMNNNMLVPVNPTPLKVDAEQAKGKKVFSLYSFKDISKREKDGSLTFSLYLDAGDGEILLLADDATFAKVANKVKSFRYENELVRYTIVAEDAAIWKVKAPQAEKLIAQAKAAAKQNDYNQAEKLAIKALAELQKQLNLDKTYVKATRQIKQLQTRFSRVARSLEKLNAPFTLRPEARVDFKAEKYKPFAEYYKKQNEKLPKIWEIYRTGNAKLVNSMCRNLDPQLTKLENLALDIQAGGDGNPSQK